MNRTQALTHVTMSMDDALANRTGEPVPNAARLIGWIVNGAPKFVAVWSYLPGIRLGDAEAVQLVTDDNADPGWWWCGTPDWII